MVVLIKTCGFKYTAKLIWQYPPTILTPIFSFWTFGPVKTSSTSKSCCGCSPDCLFLCCVPIKFRTSFRPNIHNLVASEIQDLATLCGCCSSNDMKIGVSFFYTFLNVFITIIGSLFCYLFSFRNPFYFSKCSNFSFYCDYFTQAAIVIPTSLVLGFVFTLTLKCTSKLKCCGIPVTNVQNFDIFELDVQEKNQEMTEVLTATSRTRKKFNIPDDFM